MENFIKQITRKAGNATLKKFGKIGVKYTKEDANDVVTEADLASNKIITDAIRKKYPNHGIISEETGEHQPGAEYVWIIDPLDGTLNFSTKIPLFAVMIGLAKKGRMELGAIYNPCTKEFIFAKKGEGAFLNGKRVYCSKTKEWKNSLGIIGPMLSPGTIKLVRGILKFAEKETCRLYAFGSIGVCTLFLANGRRDWQALKRGLLWDCAAPALILKEAGCKVTNFKGEPWTIHEREIVVANKFLHKKLLAIINS